MKIGVSIYSFGSYLDDASMTMEEIVQFTADAGYKGIEFADFMMPVESRLDYATELKNTLRQHNLLACGYVAISDFLNVDLDVELERLKTEIDVTVALGSHAMCLIPAHEFTDTFTTLDRSIKLVAEPIRMLADYAQEKGVLLTTENVGRIFLDSHRLEQLMDEVDHDNFRILADTGNFSDGEEDSAEALGRILHLSEQIHFKDYHFKSGEELFPGEGWYVTRGGNYIRGAIVGHGNMPMMKCLKTLVAAEYSGWLVVEFDGIEDAKDATYQSIRNIERMIEAVPAFKW